MNTKEHIEYCVPMLMSKGFLRARPHIKQIESFKFYFYRNNGDDTFKLDYLADVYIIMEREILHTILDY